MTLSLDINRFPERTIHCTFYFLWATDNGLSDGSPSIWRIRIAGCPLRLFMISIIMGKVNANVVSYFSSPSISNLRFVCHYFFFLHVIFSLSSSSQFYKSLQIVWLFPLVPFWVDVKHRSSFLWFYFHV